MLTGLVAKPLHMFDELHGVEANPGLSTAPSFMATVCLEQPMNSYAKQLA